MPVASYLVFPRPRRWEGLLRSLAAVPGCEVTPYGDSELAILVATSADAEEQKALEERLERNPDAASFALVFACAEAA